MQIVYAGPKDSKEAKGMFFVRLEPTLVTPDIARDLCSAKPRVFFYPGEQLPDAVIEDRLKLHQQDAQQFKKHIRDYTIQAAQYTDEKDNGKREGAESEIAWAEDRLQEAKEAHRQVLGSIHEDEEKIERLSQMAPQSASAVDIEVATLKKGKEQAESRVDALSKQVSELSELVLSLKSFLQQPPAGAAPSAPLPADDKGPSTASGEVDAKTGAKPSTKATAADTETKKDK